MGSSMTTEEANAIMTSILNGGGAELSPTTNQDHNVRPRAAALCAGNNSGAARNAKKLRTSSSEVSISGQSDLGDMSTASGDVTGRNVQLGNQHTGQIKGDETMIEEAENGEYPSESTQRDDDEDATAEEEPDWEKIMQFEPARTEVPIFLSACDRREESNHRYTTAVEDLDNALSHGIEELVQTMEDLLHSRGEKYFEYETNLKSDYAYIEKLRASLQMKLQKSFNAATAYFNNLLQRVAQPGEIGSGEAVGCDDNEGSDSAAGSPISRVNLGNEEPDWHEIMQHEPAKTEVPKFLDARDCREAADSRFAAAIEKYHVEMNGFREELLQTVADMFNSRSSKLDDYERMLKQEYLSNDEMRASMQSKLEASANAAQNMFETLMKRVMQQSPQPQPQDAS
mmetsp:Transcript_14050/g.28427  ORF Transcript_14050/g.28427 Transcript_14050/m.28427 type:complete len:399 (+) Transcript_14050:159-1355(+)